MKRKKLLLLGALLILCAFMLHIGAMRPSEEALSRAEALDYLLAQDDPVVLETIAPYLDGDAACRGGQGLPAAEGERVGDRMVRGDGCVYFLRADGSGLIVFSLGDGE